MLLAVWKRERGNGNKMRWKPGIGNGNEAMGIGGNRINKAIPPHLHI